MKTNNAKNKEIWKVSWPFHLIYYGYREVSCTGLKIYFTSCNTPMISVTLSQHFDRKRSVREGFSVSCSFIARWFYRSPYHDSHLSPNFTFLFRIHWWASRAVKCLWKLWRIHQCTIDPVNKKCINTAGQAIDYRLNVYDLCRCKNSTLVDRGSY